MIIIVVLAVCWLYFMAKVCNTYKQQKLILDSINTYVLRNNNAPGCKLAHDMLDSMDSFYKTLFRLFDWGYENILPPKYFVILRPYVLITKGEKINARI